LAAPDAGAEVRVCNRTGKGLNVAFSVYYLRGQTRKFESEGWRVLADKECSDIAYSGMRRVWLLGMGVDGTMWEGVTKSNPGRTFCQKAQDKFFFDDGVIADVHSSAKVCEDNGGKLKEFREFFSQSSLYTIEFEPGGSGPKGGSKAPPIWETYPDEPKQSSSRSGPKPTFAPD
jgi:uncharacterized membrane protein